MTKGTIPVFFACDDNFVKFTIVAITSLKANADKNYKYDIHVLYTKMTSRMEKMTLALADDTFHIEFNDVTPYLKKIEYKLPLRDYYSKTTYFRLFIAEMFPNYDKAIYLDSDMVIRGDLAKLYNHDIGDNYVGACNEQAMEQMDCFGTYVEKCIGLDRHKYFNAGMLVINCVQFRKQKILDQFIKLLFEYDFVVTQDEDYLNLICKDKIFWIQNTWNYEVIFKYDFKPEEINLLHYLMVGKPWHYDDCPLKEYFWEYAKQTEVYEEILDELKNYPQEAKDRDAAGAKRLQETAVKESLREDNFLNRKMKTQENATKWPFPGKFPNQEQSESRMKVIEKIFDLEKKGLFDQDVEEDPPARKIVPGEVDYMRKKLTSKIMAKWAFHLAVKFRKTIIKKNLFRLKEIRGTENLKKIPGGVMITCNHFNAFDSFAIHYVYEELKKVKKQTKFFRIIKEENYTNFPGFFGFIMKHCNTLPLGTDRQVVNDFLTSTDKLLKEGNAVLIYPEQGMWWNYRKPRPVKKGGYTIAAKAKVPILPVFMTLNDMESPDGEGFYAQEYTIHIGEPIFPKEGLDRQENVKYMMEQNSLFWKKVYEETYGVPLLYN